MTASTPASCSARVGATIRSVCHPRGGTTSAEIRKSVPASFAPQPERSARGISRAFVMGIRRRPLRHRHLRPGGGLEPGHRPPA